MTLDPILIRQVERDEGGPFLLAYPDPLSPLARWATQRHELWGLGPAELSGAPWTIGYGHTGPEVVRGYRITGLQASNLLTADLAGWCATLARVLPWTAQLDPPRLRVLQNMIFNMGWDDPKTPAHEGLSGFTTFLSLVKTGQYPAAADDGLTTLWARQTKTRATRAMQQLRTGADVL